MARTFDIGKVTNLVRARVLADDELRDLYSAIVAELDEGVQSQAQTMFPLLHRLTAERVALMYVLQLRETLDKDGQVLMSTREMRDTQAVWLNLMKDVRAQVKEAMSQEEIHAQAMNAALAAVSDAIKDLPAEMQTKVMMNIATQTEQ